MTRASVSCCSVEREEVVERVGVAVGRQPHLAADHDAGPAGQAGDRRASCGCRCRSTAVGETASNRASQRLRARCARSRPWVNFAPPSASRLPVADRRRQHDGEAAASRRARRAGSTSVALLGATRRRRARAAPRQRDAGGLGLALGLRDRRPRRGASSRPSRVCCSRNQPTTPTTSAESSERCSAPRAPAPSGARRRARAQQPEPSAAAHGAGRAVTRGRPSGLRRSSSAAEVGRARTCRPCSRRRAR